jgi:hypothetical protein
MAFSSGSVTSIDFVLSGRDVVVPSINLSCRLGVNGCGDDNDAWHVALGLTRRVGWIAELALLLVLLLLLLLLLLRGAWRRLVCLETGMLVVALWVAGATVVARGFFGPISDLMP